MIGGVTVLDNAREGLDILANPVWSRLVAGQLQDVASCVQNWGVEDIVECAFTLLNEKVSDDVRGEVETPVNEIRWEVQEPFMEAWQVFLKIWDDRNAVVEERGLVCFVNDHNEE